MSECKFADKLTELRAEANMTQAELAEKLSVSDKVISKWENGLSAPDLDALVLIAEIFGVSTDTLLGISNNKKAGIAQTIANELEGLDRRQAIMTAFEISNAIIPSVLPFVRNFIFEYPKEKRSEELFYPVLKNPVRRNCIFTPEFYNLTVNSDDVNMSVMLLRNKFDFAWMKNPDSQEKITRLFKFLSDPDVLSVCYFIYSLDCSVNFTEKYIAEKTGISEEKVKEILEASVDLKIFSKKKVYMLSGEVELYEFRAEGDILSLITLAYERQCGEESYCYHVHEDGKMIGGTDK